LKLTVILVHLAVLVAAVACSNGSDDAAPPRVDATAPVAGSSPPTQAPGRLTLLAGEFRLVAAAAFGDPGFHEVVAVTADVPTDLGDTAGLKMVLKLRDAGRSEQTCSREHPLSGCATVDWSDAVGRPKVPANGVFENSIALELESGTRTFFLSEAGTLEDAPDAFEPG
jgi:hypothetical protein